MRRLTLLGSVKHWSLRSVQTKLIKMGGRLVRHARRLVFQLAEVAVSREVFRQVLERIAGLHPAPGCRISLRSSEVKRGNQTGGARLEEFEGVQNVVKAASVAWQPLTHDAERWFCELAQIPHLRLLGWLLWAYSRCGVSAGVLIGLCAASLRGLATVSRQLWSLSG